MKIMAHTVIGYPNLEASRGIVEQYIKAGFQILELQIPFSHPTADGTILTQANRLAAEHTSVQQSLDFLKEINKACPNQHIMAMTYFNKIFAYGTNNFCKELAEANISHLIVPDLPFDSPFAEQINQHPTVQLVPVLSANVSDERLKKVMQNKPDYLYIMADYKITGSAFSIHPKVQELIQDAKKLHPAKVGLGFGISTAEQVHTVLEVADFAIMGSALMKALEADTLDTKLNELQSGLSSVSV